MIAHSGEVRMVGLYDGQIAYQTFVIVETNKVIALSEWLKMMRESLMKRVRHDM